MRRLFGWLKRIRGRAPPELPLQPEAGSPERLDELVVIARPRMWISLAVLVALLGVLVAWSFIGDIPTKLDGRAMFAFANGPVTVDAPADGRITGRLARLDQRVRVGQPLLRIRTGGRTVVVRSPVDGVVAIRAPLPDDAVRRGEAVFKINPLNRRLRLFAYMPLSDAKSIVRGLDVQVSPSNAPKAARQDRAREIDSTPRDVAAVERPRAVPL
jgi:multidrug efflux pump subunit AcrA (membrane-fusion protein)